MDYCPCVGDKERLNAGSFMTVKNKLEDIIMNTKVDSFLEAIKEFNVEEVVSSKDVDLSSRSILLTNFYNDLLHQPGMVPEIASRAFVGMVELFVRRSILRAFMLNDDVVEKPSKEKNIQDFRSYLLYAANKFGDSKDVKAVTRLVEKITDGKAKL